jgi:hypothetical protein
LPPVARIEAFVQEVVSALADGDGFASCLLINSTMELAAGDPVMRSSIAACLGEVEEFIRRGLDEAVARGEVSPGLPVRDTAQGVMIMLLGLHVQARLRPGFAALESATRPMLSLLRQGSAAADPCRP